MAVYVFQRGLDGPIKVGYSEDPWKRRAMLQTAMPERLRIVGLNVIGDKEFEAMLHRLLRKWRMAGEWFEAAEAAFKILETKMHLLDRNGIDHEMPRRKRQKSPEQIEYLEMIAMIEKLEAEVSADRKRSRKDA